MENPLLNADFQISSFKMKYRSLQDHIKENCKTENMDILKLAELCLTFAVANMSNLKQVLSQHGEDPLSSLLRMITNGKPYAEHDSLKAVEVFLQQ